MIFKRKEFSLTKIKETTEEMKGIIIEKNFKKIQKLIKKAAKEGDYVVSIINEDYPYLKTLINKFMDLGFAVEENFHTSRISWRQKDLDKIKYFVVIEESDEGTMVHGLCNAKRDALLIKHDLVTKAIKECFNINPKDSGLDEKLHKEQITKECEQAFKIIGIKEINRILRKDDVVNAEENCN